MNQTHHIDSDTSTEIPPVNANNSITNNTKCNEFSLVDIALILIRRRYLLLTVFLLTLMSGIGITTFDSKISTYSSVINIGNYISDRGLVSFEPSSGLLARIQNAYIPSILNNKEYNISVISESPKDSDIIILTASGNKDQNEVMIKALNDIAELIIKDHTRIYTSLVNSTSSSNKKAMGGDTSKSFIVETSIQNTYVLPKPYFKGFVSNMNTKLIITASIVLGLLIGILSAFILEFLTIMRKEIKSSHI